MKWIKSRQQFLNEAKLKDVIFAKQAKEVKKVWGEKYLDYEEVTPTANIKQGKWKLTDEDKMNVLGEFFDCNIKQVYDIFKEINDKFASVIAASINTDLYQREDAKIIMKDFNVKNPTIDQIVFIYEPVFRKISASETLATEIIQRDDTGRPLRDESGNMIKTQKEKGQVVYSNNLVNINSFLEDYNRCFPEEKLGTGYFQNSEINQLVNMAKIDENRAYKVDFEIFNKDLYLSITHNPKDILNMSISKFYASCQHLYTGGYREQVLSNVFDPNSIPAFLTFETPIFWDDEKISDQLPLSRMIIRNIETFDDNQEPKIFFDRAYPDRMKKIFEEIITKYSGNKSNVTERDSITYIFTPDVDPSDKLRSPYMDRLSVEEKPYIGKNTKTLHLSRMSDWTKCRISPEARIKELIVETTEIPENLSTIPLTLDWIKFKYLRINTISNFEKIKSSQFAFDKCKFDASLLNEICKTNPDITKLQLISCDTTGELNFSQFPKLEELHVVYTLDTIEDLTNLTTNLKVRKLVISGDLIRGKEEKSIIEGIRKRGVRVEILGPVI